MPKIVSVRLHGPEGDTSQTVDLQNALRSLVVRDHDDIRFLPNTNLVSDGVDTFLLLVSVERKVVQAPVGESVTVICTGRIESACARGDSAVICPGTYISRSSPSR